VFLRAHDPGGEAVAEEVAAAAVAAVEALGVDAVQPAHARGQVGAAGVDDEVVVVAHQAERVCDPGEASDRPREDGEEEPPIVVVAEDPASVHAAAVDVVGAVRKLRPCDPRHRPTVAPT
jgi:hypothetical protein